MADAGQRDVPEALRGAGTVDGRRLVLFLRHRLQRRQERDHPERETAPESSQDHAGHGQFARAEELHVRVHQSQADQDHVEGSALGGIQQPPRNVRDKRRHCPRQQDQPAPERARVNGLIEQQGDAETEHQLHGLNRNHQDDGVHDGGAEAGQPSQVSVITETNERPLGADLPIGEADPDGEHERIRHQDE